MAADFGPSLGLRAFTHTQFAIRLPSEAAAQAAGEGPRTYTVEVKYFDSDGEAALYRDGRQHLVAELPAAFPVPGGAIEIATSTFGMKRRTLRQRRR